jgi:transcriptional regulator with PAS, ATPase and Fis domain
VITLADLPDGVRSRGGSPAVPAVFPQAIQLTARRPDEEVWLIQEALRKHGNVRARAAKELGISRVSFYKKLHKYGLFDQPS